MKKFVLVFVVIALSVSAANAQIERFRQWYPIGEDADLHYKTSYIKSETVFFEANPIVRYSIYNDMIDVIGSKFDDNHKKHGQAYYIAFKPQFRMYTDTSRPVRTPTYKVQAGIQHLFKMEQNNFLSIALESGHFSNGQSGSSFSNLYADGSRQGDSMYTLINSHTNLSDMLNRQSGNFSTNITELNFNYRSNHLSTKDTWRNMPDWIHSATLGFVLYHNNLLGLIDIGGFTKNDIEIYGRMRYQLGYELTHVFYHKPVKKKRPDDPDRENVRITFSERIEIIQGAHPFVNPFRSETRINVAPGGHLSKDLVLFAGLVVGHDNYNYRFVDSGTQFIAGIAWSCSPPPNIGRKEDAQTEDPEDSKEDNTSK